MNYVDKNTALKYLANSEKLFNKVKDSFLNSYRNAKDDIKALCISNDIDELYRYIHSIKGISLNIGSMVLYEDCEAVLEIIKKEARLPSLEQFTNTLLNVYSELLKL